jgi:sporulation protein YlmC with PRC-barrel domain
MDKHIMLKRFAAGALALALLAAACTPATSSVPIGTESGLGTTTVTTPVASAQATTGGLGTAAATKGTAVGTAVGTSEGTAVGTAVGTAEGTAVGTAEGTAVGTAQATAVRTQAAPTGTPNAIQQPSVLLSSELIGSQIVDQDGNEIGTVEDLLVDDQGAVQYVVFDASDFLNGNTGNATPVATSSSSNATPVATSSNATPQATALATSDATAVDEGLRAVPLTDFTVNTNASADDNEDQVLKYTGTNDSLMSMGPFNKALLDEDSFIIDASQSTVAADTTYDGMIRLSKLDDINLQNGTGDELGETKDAILDLNEKMVKYDVVDFGGFLGIGEQTTAVPWDLITVNQTGDTANMMLQANPDSLDNAPTIDLGDWPAWPERVDTNSNWTTDWESQIHTFWDGAASQ